MTRAVKVHFVYRTVDIPYGGANTFNKNLKTQFKRTPALGVEVCDDASNADVLFVNAASRGPHRRLVFSWKRRRIFFAEKDLALQPWQLSNLRRKRALLNPLGHCTSEAKDGIAVVQRLDGITRLYGRSDGRSYDDLQIRLNRQAVMTIFQSVYCRESFLPHLRSGIASTIILNGADGDVFKWKARSKPASKIKILAASWSKNPAKGHGDLVSLSRLKNVELFYAGRWPEGVDRGAVRVMTPMNQSALAEFMGDCDLFAHLAENDPSPNAVGEALAVGLPVLYRQSGGTPEIVDGTRFGEPVQDGSESVLSSALEKILSRYDDLTAQIKINRSRFLIESAAKSYADVFKAAVIQR